MMLLRYFHFAAISKEEFSRLISLHFLEELVNIHLMSDPGGNS